MNRVAVNLNKHRLSSRTQSLPGTCPGVVSLDTMIACLSSFSIVVIKKKKKLGKSNLIKKEFIWLTESVDR